MMSGMRITPVGAIKTNAGETSPTPSALNAMIGWPPPAGPRTVAKLGGGNGLPGAEEARVSQPPRRFQQKECAVVCRTDRTAGERRGAGEEAASGINLHKKRGRSSQKIVRAGVTCGVRDQSGRTASGVRCAGTRSRHHDSDGCWPYIRQWRYRDRAHRGTDTARETAGVCNRERVRGVQPVSIPRHRRWTGGHDDGDG